jgi:alpha-glucosidase
MSHDVGDDDAFLWWKHGVIYQVYPRSFQDTNGDGIGDLEGVIARLDDLVTLGVDAIWLSPVFCSPMKDFGYDISDHVGIDRIFGDLATFDWLVRKAHAKGLKVILDFVPNHTSDLHLWFLESRSSRTNPRRDWYVWRDPAPGGGPPNNWRSEFGGPAWTLDPATGQYFYHAFLSSQPDLNWRNPDVVRAMLDVVGFWLNRGVDGFRVDAIHHLFEDEGLTDNPPNPAWEVGMPPAEELLRLHTIDQPQVHGAVTALRRLTERNGPDKVLIGEAYLPLERLMAYYGGEGEGFHLPFNFHLMTTPWRPKDIASLVEAYEAQLPAHGWPNWVLGNHDRSRLATRLGPAQARVAAMLLLTLRGTPTIYQGEELGLSDVAIPFDQVRDPWELNVPGLGLGRDPVRTPIPWSEAPNAGFSTAEPWLPLNPDWRESNADRQSRDPGSVLSLYRSLLRLRRAHPALTHGAYRTRVATDSVLAYERRAMGESLLVALNLSDRQQRLGWPVGELLLSTSRPKLDRPEDGILAPNEGVIFRPFGPASVEPTT